MITWDKTYGGMATENLKKSIPTSDGGILMVGYSDSGPGFEKSQNGYGSYDFWIVKINSSGGIIWERTYGGSGLDLGNCVVELPDGGFAIGGTSGSNISGDKTENVRGIYDFWLIRIDSAGNLLWDKTYGGAGLDEMESILLNPDTTLLLGGFSDSQQGFEKGENSKGGRDFWLIKIRKDGTIIWEKTIGGVGADWSLNSMVLLPDMGYLLGGISDSDSSGDKSADSRGYYDYWVVKINNLGDIEWDKTYGGNLDDRLYDILETEDGNYFLAGISGSIVSGERTAPSRGASDIWLIKIDINGDTIWNKAYGGLGGESAFSIIPGPFGGYVLGGSSSSDISGEKSENRYGVTDYWIVGIDAHGNYSWDKTLGATGDDRLQGLVYNPSAGFILTGNSNSNVNNDKSENGRGDYDYWAIAVNFSSQPPVAGCMDITVPADGNCKAVVQPDLLNFGSFDPDGDAITFSIYPAGPFPLGENVVDFIVSDGTFSDTCQSTITVTSGLQLDLGDNKTVYHGYPDSVCVSLGPLSVGNIGVVSYQWSTGETSPMTNVCPMVSTSYILTVTGTDGCSSSDTIEVCVVDVVCFVAGTNYKVLVCHEDSTTGNTITLCVPVNAVENHLSHGDKLGSCGLLNCITSSSVRMALPFVDGLGLSAYPNPLQIQTRIEIISPFSSEIKVTIRDILGKPVKELFDGEISKGELISIIFDGSDLADGIYFCEVITPWELQSLKLMIKR